MILCQRHFWHISHTRSLLLGQGTLDDLVDPGVLVPGSPGGGGGQLVAGVAGIDAPVSGPVCKLPPSNCDRRFCCTYTPDFRLQIPGSRVQAPDYRVQTAGSRFQIPDCRLQIPLARSCSPNMLAMWGSDLNMVGYGCLGCGQPSDSAGLRGAKKTRAF